MTLVFRPARRASRTPRAALQCLPPPAPKFLQPPVERGQRDADPHGPAGEQVEIPPHQRALGEHAERKAALQQQFAAAAGQPPLGLDRLPAVAGAADEDLAGRGPAQLPLEHLDGVDLHIDELAPGLVMGMEPLHESGVAVDAGVAAARVAVQRVVAQPAPVENRLADGFADDND